jgi:hypothetical protein
MAISVVQAESVSNGGSLTSPVTPGSTVLILPVCYEFGSALVSTSSPELGGTPYTGAALLASSQNAYQSATTAAIGYTAAWMLPDVQASGLSSISLSVSGGNILDLFAMEITGLGSPSLDQSSTGSDPDSDALTSGTTGAITSAPEIVIAGAVLIDEAIGSPGAPWTVVQDGTQFGQLAYQIASGSGGTYTWSATGAATNAWAALCVTIASSAAPAQPPAQPARSYPPPAMVRAAWY